MAEIDFSAVFSPSDAVNDICWEIEGIGLGGLTGHFAGSDMAYHYPLPVTDQVRDFAVIAWLDEDHDNQWDSGEDKREVEVHVIDLDTDSNNDGEIKHGSDHPVENKTGELGKRIFVNTDDDNQNGIPDMKDTSATNENDFAEIKVLGGANLPAGYELRLKVSDYLKLYSSTGKQAMAASTGGWQYKWTSGSIYAEGTKVGALTVTWCIFDTAKNIEVGVEHTLKINVEKIVYPFKDQAANWNKQETSQWKGLNVGEGWYIDKALVDYIKNPNNQGKVETIHPDMNGGTTASSAGVGSLSTDTYANGFTLEFDYSFEHRGNNPYGYVQADVYKGGQLLKKLSFVGNSGIKFGKAMVNGKLKDFEIAILDVKAMVALAGGLGKFRSSSTVSIPGYASEHLSQLMSGVRYDGAYQNMTNYNPAGQKRYLDLLKNNYNHANSHMKIDVTKVDGTFTVNVLIDNQQYYSESGISLLNLGNFLVQSHWGSGVVFSNMQFTKK